MAMSVWLPKTQQTSGVHTGARGARGEGGTVLIYLHAVEQRRVCLHTMRLASRMFDAGTFSTLHVRVEKRLLNGASSCSNEPASGD